MPPSTPLFVFSHPNHELAVLGHIMRMRPQLLYLTDGGSLQRVEETKESLDALGLLGHARFLLESEQGFYARLLAHDVSYFTDVARRIRERVRDTACDAVYCDGVEYYNPTHDLSRPLVERALDGTKQLPLYEIPLVRQITAVPQQYEIQRFSPRAAVAPAAITLTDEELETKLAARAARYPSLLAEMGNTLAAVPAAHARTEVTGQIVGPPLEPGADTVVRYDWRGTYRRERGEVEVALTRAAHYDPVAQGLRARASAPSP